jgi:hypothetical protein
LTLVPHSVPREVQLRPVPPLYGNLLAERLVLRLRRLALVMTPVDRLVLDIRHHVVRLWDAGAIFLVELAGARRRGEGDVHFVVAPDACEARGGGIYHRDDALRERDRLVEAGLRRIVGHVAAQLVLIVGVLSEPKGGPHRT